MAQADIELMETENELKRNMKTSWPGNTLTSAQLSGATSGDQISYGQADLSQFIKGDQDTKTLDGQMSKPKG